MSKRQRVCTLLNALVSPKQISRIVGVSKKLFAMKKKKMIMSKTITRKTGSRGSKKNVPKHLSKPSNLRFKKTQRNPCEKWNMNLRRNLIEKMELKKLKVLGDV